MKIRTGFVSNSSSSSFIIPLKKQFSVNELKNIMFDGEDEFKYYGTPESSHYLASMLHESIEDYIKSSPSDDSKILELLESSYSSYDFKYNFHDNNSIIYSDSKLKEEYKIISFAGDAARDKSFECSREWSKKLDLDKLDYKERQKILDSNKEYKKESTKLRNQWVKLNKQEQEFRTILAKKDLENYRKKYPTEILAIVEFGDDTNTGSILEHSGCIENISNGVVRFSHH